MTRCHLCRHSHLCRQHRRYKLVHRDTLKPSRMCFESIFSWNNETVNIWSHFFGFIYFTWVQIHNIFFVLPGIGANSNDYIMMFLSVFGSQLCMASSAGYHTFGCINSRTRKTWLRADVFGISAGLLGMYLGGIYTSFYCFPDIQNTYLLGLLHEKIH
uniref:Uncharacterized protein n=1 Tax=Panagrolaimus superbus TaxID=310955 RepID=A0A914XWS5_9BILA